MEISAVRSEVEELLALSRWREATSKLKLIWDSKPSAPLAAYIASVSEKLRGNLELTTHRLALLRSFTVEPIVPVLKTFAFTSGLDLCAHVGEFNAYAQEILDSASPLYQFHPDTVILAVQTRDIAPDLWNGTATSGAIDRVTTQFESWFEAFRRATAANLIVHSLEVPPIPVKGVLDSQAEDTQAAAIQQVNRNLRKLAGRFRSIYILDYEGLVARHGRQQWGDERKWLTVRLPIAATHLVDMAREWMRFLAPLTGKTAKAVVVDLDNTLWGGTIGEDGLAGIQAGAEHPGGAYQALQKALLDLSQRGILLAVCSKNNPEDGLSGLAEHPGMLLRPENFAALRINWNEKPHNLREIAAELNIGLDSIAFLDDNPVERQAVREQLPEVMVLELPGDPIEYAGAVRDYPAFERLALSEEDRHRNHYYAAERQRSALEQTFTSREDFYRSLEQVAEIERVQPLTLSRIAQLTQKTNQFNLTTKRYTEQQISDLSKCPGWQVLSIRVKDRYADNGLVGIAITHDAGDTCTVDTFLLSCRVIGRTVETALLSYLADRARERGAKNLEGWFIPTKKNAPAKNFYRDHGFQLLSETEAGQLWSLELGDAQLGCPDWVRIVGLTETATAARAD